MADRDVRHLGQVLPLAIAASGQRRWPALILGAALVVVGLILALNPFRSLGVLIILVAAGLILAGLSRVAEVRTANASRTTLVVGALLVAAGIAALVWPGLTTRTLAVGVGLVLLLNGVAQLADAVRGTVDQRVAAALLGVASLVMGALALAWPDVTVLVVSVVFGLWLVLQGARLVTGAPVAARRNRPPRTGPRRWGHTLAAVAAVVVAIAVLALSIGIRRSDVSPDAFYSSPEQIPSTPGTLIRSEPFSRGLPAGTRAWRILYSTTAADGSPTIASGLVAVGASAPTTPLPVVAWAHGTTGVDIGCAPTLLPNPFDSGAAVLNDALARGWAVVATDYMGLGTAGGHEYLVGRPAARAVLDSVRAARQLGDVTLADETVVWGHSQGGNSALWTGLLAPTYAPELSILGINATSPASDLPALASGLESLRPGGNLFASFVIVGYERAYPDVRLNDYVAPTAQLQAREMAARCLPEAATLVSIIMDYLFGTAVWTDPTAGPLGDRLRENIPTGPSAMPLFIAQGAADPLVLRSVQDAYVAGRCAAGANVAYTVYEGKEHVDVLTDGSELLDDLPAWTQARFDGAPQANSCR